MKQFDIRAVLDSRSDAIRTKDIERLMSHYSPDVIYFDVVPPLQHSGSAALRERFSEWFHGYTSGIGQEIYDLNVRMGEDVAIASMLIWSDGTLVSGQEIGLWVRATSCFQRSEDRWLITHEHVSLPSDLRSGRAAMDLDPGFSRS